MVGCQRKIPHAASDRAGTADVSARPAAGTFRERPGRGLAVFGTALDSRRGLRRRPGVRAAGAAGRGDDGDRPRGREHRGGPPARRRPGSRHRLSRRAHRGPGRGGTLVRCRHLPGGGGARAGRGRVSQDLRGPGAARRADAALDHQSHDQGVSAGHRGGGVRAALAAGRHAPVGTVRDAGGAWAPLCRPPASAHRCCRGSSTARSRTSGRCRATPTSTTSRPRPSPAERGVPLPIEQARVARPGGLRQM